MSLTDLKHCQEALAKAKSERNEYLERNMEMYRELVTIQAEKRQVVKDMKDRVVVRGEHLVTGSGSVITSPTLAAWLKEGE